MGVENKATGDPKLKDSHKPLATHVDLPKIHYQNHIMFNKKQQQIKYSTCINHNLCQETLAKRLLQMTNKRPRLPKHI